MQIMWPDTFFPKLSKEREVRKKIMGNLLGCQRTRYDNAKELGCCDPYCCEMIFSYKYHNSGLGKGATSPCLQGKNSFPVFAGPCWFLEL